MTDLRTLGSDVEWPDHAAAEAIRDQLAADPRLGRLAGLAEWVAQVLPPPTEGPFSAVRALVVGAEPADPVTSEMASGAGVSLRTVAPAADDTAAALDAGAELADADIDTGADLLIVAVTELTSAAAIAVSVLTNTEPVKVLTRGAAATDPDVWMQRAVEVRDARRRCMPLRDEPDQLLVELGNASLATAAGVVLRAASRRTPVLLDGPAATVAALVAYEAAPRAVRWWCASDLGADPLQELALSRLGLQSVLGLGTGRGDGLAAMLAVPVLRAAARLAAAHFDSDSPASEG